MLRFYCIWDDRQALSGDRRPYRLHYFLEDDTVEVLEVHEPNSGRHAFPVFLRRDRLPKVGGLGFIPLHQAVGDRHRLSMYHILLHTATPAFTADQVRPPMLLVHMFHGTSCTHADACGLHSIESGLIVCCTGI